MAENFENVCVECSKSFVTEDSNAEICPACWEKVIAEHIKEEGK